MDGIEAAAEIRERYDIPVVTWTAYATHNTLQRAQITSPIATSSKPLRKGSCKLPIEMALYSTGMEKERSMLGGRSSRHQKLETAQALVAGIVHEFNNLMTTIIRPQFIPPVFAGRRGMNSTLRTESSLLSKPANGPLLLTQQVLASASHETRAQPLDRQYCGQRDARCGFSVCALVERLCGE